MRLRLDRPLDALEYALAWQGLDIGLRRLVHAYEVRPIWRLIRRVPVRPGRVLARVPGSHAWAPAWPELESQPLGWMAVREWDTYCYLIGPWWLMLPYRAWRRRWELLGWLDRLDSWLAWHLFGRVPIIGAPTRPGLFLERPGRAAYLWREIRPRGWSWLQRQLSTFRAELPRWE